MLKPSPSLRIALAQFMSVPGDVKENLARLRPMVADAARRGAGLVLTSECALTGYDLENLATSKALPLNDPALDKVAAMARRYGVAIVGAFYERLDKKSPKGFPTVHNSAVCFYPDGRRVLQRKHNVIALEKDASPTMPGPRKRTIFKVGPLRCAILICADGGIEGIFEELAAAGVDAVLAPTAGLGRVAWGMREAELKTEEGRKKLLEKAPSLGFPVSAMERSMKLNMGVATCNQAGYVEKLGFFQPGHSMCIDTNGDLTALICGKWICEWVTPELAVGVIHARKRRR